jgi:hypothetical protein
MAMNFILRTFFNLFLVVSLAATPLGTALASVYVDHDLSMYNSTNPESCHEVMQEQTPSKNSQHDSSMPLPCSCSNDCNCADSSGCNNVVTPLVLSLAGMMLAVHVQARDVFATIRQDDYLSLDFPPDSPPPLV